MDMNTATGSGFQAGRKEWIGLAVLALPTLLLALDMSVLYLALPHLSADLAPSSTQQLWIIDIYGFMIAGFLITMGTLGDRIGRRKLLLIGAAAFAAASVVAAFSTSAGMLIATRALLGIAGATLMPSTLALISNMFRDPKQRGTAIAVWISCFMGGTAIGPVVGGAILEFFWWGSVFLLGVPVMLLLLATAPFLLPEYRDTEAGRLDLTSVVLSLAAILPVIYGLKELAKDGLETGAVLTVAAGLVFAVLFVQRQRRLSDPLVDVRLFSNRFFSSGLAINLVVAITMGGTFLFVSQYLQLVEGLSPLKAGLWMVPSTITMIIGTMLAPAIAQRIGPGNVIAGGMAIAAAGLLLLTQVDSSSGLTILVASMAITTFGVGGPFALVTDLVVGSVRPEKAGSASAISETSGEFGIALGIATLGSLGTIIYRNQMTDTIPAGVPTGSAETARESITGGVSVAGQLPAPLSAELLDGAREAFTIGMTTVAGVGAAAAAVCVLLAVVLLRNMRPSGDVQADDAGCVLAAAAGYSFNESPMTASD